MAQYSCGAGRQRRPGLLRPYPQCRRFETHARADLRITAAGARLDPRGPITTYIVPTTVVLTGVVTGPLDKSGAQLGGPLK